MVSGKLNRERQETLTVRKLTYQARSKTGLRSETVPDTSKELLGK